MTLKIKSKVHNIYSKNIGLISHQPVGKDEYKNRTYLVLSNEEYDKEYLKNYAGVICNKTNNTIINYEIPIIETDEILTDGTIISVLPTGSIYQLYRPESKNNFLFATNSCNSNCIMCPQPPSKDDILSRVKELLDIISLIKSPPISLGITGGEPLLLGDGLIEILAVLKEKFPETAVHILTNGRLLAYRDFAKKIGGIGHQNLVMGIPLFSDNPEEHDYIVQAKGSFDQTLQGILNSARFNIPIEIRTVLHKQTITRLMSLCSYIYKNLPFVVHVALMGMEHMGYVKKNLEELWIDPIDYKNELENAVKFLNYRRINVSIYNLQLCVIPKSTWSMAVQSISDYKNIYLDECTQCKLKEKCGGLFQSTKKYHSRAISPILIENTIFF